MKQSGMNTDGAERTGRGFDELCGIPKWEEAEKHTRRIFPCIATMYLVYSIQAIQAPTEKKNSALAEFQQAQFQVCLCLVHRGNTQPCKH